MSAAKHTPGPWAQHTHYPWIIKQDLTPIADADDGITVCNTTAHDNSGFFPTPEEGRANARLIAAAPDLLDALNQLVQHVVDKAPADFMEGALRTAERAITKAQGGAA